MKIQAQLSSTTSPVKSKKICWGAGAARLHHFLVPEPLGQAGPDPILMYPVFGKNAGAATADTKKFLSPRTAGSALSCA
jgi:hypothetical protein